MTRPSPSEPDTRLVGLLERAFAAHAGKDGVIDAEEFRRALGLRSEYLSQRVFSLFDRNLDGRIQQGEFIEGAKRLIAGDAREKLWFAFRLHDHDGDGFIDQTEMVRMISMAMAESEIIERSSQPAEYLARVLFKAADSNGDGRISFEEFAAATLRRPELLQKMTQNESIWIAPNEDLWAWLGSPEASVRGESGSQASRWIHASWLTVWLLANLVILSPLGTLGFSASAASFMAAGRTIGHALNFNGALILLPTMRRLLTRVRASALGKFIPVDHAIGFHRLLGHTLFGLALAHAACFSLAYAGGHALHPVTDLFLRTMPGVTGAALLTVFSVMWLCALGFVRRTKRFELFYFTHLLYLVWLGVLIAHAPSFLLWAGVPLLGFIAEQVLRLRLRARASHVVASTVLRSAVTRLDIERPSGFRFSAADYIFLRIPAIAKHEWHPFTVSSAPEADKLVVHVRSLGNWSAALRRQVEASPGAALTVYVDGPYGSPSAHIFRSRVAVLIGAGIGVTPFASVLESMVLRANGHSSEPSNLQKAYFFWLNRDQYSFEWFTALLAELEKSDQRGLMDVHLCMTGAAAGAAALGLELAREVMHASGRSDMITGLRTHTHFGHPDWSAMLGEIRARHATEAVDVYFCGPPGLAAQLASICKRLRLSFRQEQF
ncbi:MAG: EF-hand domain-containing protein [Polyangiaceae bacterium]